MSNICRITDAYDTFSGYNEEFLLNEDIQLQINTQMTSYGEQLGSLADLVSMVTNVNTLGGQITQGNMNLENLMDAPRWKKTDPLKINLELTAFSETYAEWDVYNKIMELVNYSIPWFKSLNPASNTMTLPGINLNTTGEYQSRSALKRALIAKGKGAANLQFLKNHSSLIALEIPGVIYLESALVKAAIPTFSKEMTKSEWPLWGKLAIEIWSLSPATSKMFEGIKYHKTVGSLTGGF